MSRTRLLALLLVGAACAGGDAAGYSNQPPPPPPPPGTNPPPTTATVAIQSSDDGYGNAEHRFNPGSVTIARTGTVTWVNESGFTHNVVFTPRAGVPANIPDHAAGSNARTFNTASSFAYRCSIHNIQGTVVVQ